MKSIFLLLFGMGLLFMACNITSSRAAYNSAAPKVKTKADVILEKAIQAHGGQRYQTAHYQFVFRDKTYTFKNQENGFQYTVKSEKEGQTIVDRLDNNGLERTIDGVKTVLSAKDIAKYKEALNSVIYFATLPHKLQDPAVKLSHEGVIAIKGNNYDVLEVRFNEEDGGVDHDDEFHYWVNQETSRIDYLAYNYQTNKGGVRFRSAYNPRVVEGIVFQDYVNFKAPVGTPLADLPALFEKGELQKLSLIETEAVAKQL